jgi:EmrB/QacA subfamily drug resistance transporter
MQMTSQQARPVERVGVRPGVLTTILVGSAFMAGLDLFIVNVAFDEIGRDFAGHAEPPSLSDLSWILNAYAVVFAALLVPMGRLTDRYGRKNGFIAGLTVFVVASAACAFSGDVWQLVAFRGLQAVGAAAMTPASLGLLLAALPQERRAPAARLWAMTGAIAAAIGPAVGGVLVELSWHWAFLINLPIGIVLIAAAIRYVPDVRHNEGAPRPDLTGAAILAVAIGALVLGLVKSNEWGWSSPGVLASFAVSLVGLAAFAWLTAHHASPVIDPALLRIRAFVLANVATLLFHIGFGASLLAGILWMQQTWDYSAVRTGLGVATGPVMVPITALLVQRLLPLVRTGLLVAIGCTLAAVAAVWMGLSLSLEPAYATTFLPAWLVMGVAVGLAMPNLIASATSTLPPEQTSTGGGIVSMSRQIGMVLGVSLLVSIIGSEPPATGTFGAAWSLVAVVSVLAAVAAYSMEKVRG